MNTLRYWPLLLIVICLPAAALEPGTLQADSYLDQPLEARLPLRAVDERELANLRFSLADRATYRRYRLHPPFEPQSVQFSVVVGERGEPELRLSSRQPVTDPIVDILLKVMSGRDAVIRRYTLFLDPPGIAPLAAATNDTGANPAPGQQPMRVQSSTPNRGTRPAPARSALAGTTRLAPDTGDYREFVQEKGLSLSMIAQNSKLHEKFSVYQIMRAVYLTNPGAFADGNINRLIYGSRLIIPAESLIAEVPRRAAIEFVKAVSRDNPPGIPPLRTGRTTYRAVAGETASGPGDTVPERPGSAATTRKPATATQHRNPDTSAEVIGILTDRSEQRRAVIDKPKPGPETAAPVSISADAAASVDRASAAQDRTADRSREIAELDRELQHKDRQILELTRRVEALQRAAANDTAAAEKPDARSASDQPATGNPPPAGSSSPSAAIALQSPAPASGAVRHVLTWGLPALVLLLGAAFGWYRRVRGRRGPNAETPPENLLAETIESHAAKVDIDITEMSPAKVVVPADEATQPELKPVATDDAPTGETRTNSEELLLEIDVRLAYELYPEALEMLEQARREHGDTVWIDAKTLETYAAMGKRPEFLELFEQKRAALEAASPIVWAEISALHANIERQVKLASAG